MSFSSLNFVFQLFKIIEALLNEFNQQIEEKKIISYIAILSPIVFYSFLLHVIFVQCRPEIQLFPAAFTILPTILYNNYYTDYGYSDNMFDNDKIIFSMMPYNMCFVSKCMNTAEKIMVILP